MSNANPITFAPPTIQVEPTRTRQTTPPGTPFRDVLARGGQVLLSGAEIATRVVAGPVAAAAVAEATAGVRGSAPGLGSPTGGGGSEFDRMHALQQESQSFNLQLLALQEQIQQENRQFSTLTNVLRARHDTARAAIANIRS